MVYYVDIVFFWVIYFECWDFDVWVLYNFWFYVGFCILMVEFFGEVCDVCDFFFEFVRKIGGGMEEWYEYGLMEDYIWEWVKNVFENEVIGKVGFDCFFEEGVWEN